MRWIQLLVFLLWSGGAAASARIVVTTPEPVQLFMDGMLIPTSVGNVRSAIPHVRPGPHTLAIHDLRGNLLHSESIDVPSGADVRVQWSPGSAFVVTGTESASSAGEGGIGPSAAPTTDYTADSPSGVARSEPIQSQSAGNLGRASGPRPSDLIQGNGMSTGRTSVLQRAVTSPNPTALAAGAAVGGVRSLTYGAKSGTSFGDGTEFRQKIVQANVVYGQVDLIKGDGGPIHVYEAGMLVARLGAGETRVRTKMEVGRREIEIRSGLDNRVLFRGDLNVEQDHNIQLSVSDTVPPKPTVRPWLWQGY